MPDLRDELFHVSMVHEQVGDERPFPPLGPAIRALMVWPQFPPSFWGFEGVLKMLPESAMTPPLGLITVAALCPPKWSIRLIDRAFQEVTDQDIKSSDLIMISAMHAQRGDAREILRRARALGCRTMVGGPWASSHWDAVLPDADHVVVGEVEEAFASIAADLENGTARRLYQVAEKPGMAQSPVPRYDLLRLNQYTSMPVQFSRGCPFQCEFCDIITIYGRKPRTKTSAQITAALDELRRLGWRNEVFIVDDNFIGNSKLALQLARDLKVWQESQGYPFSFYTEASVNLADLPELLAAMVEANFMYVFLGIETPSAEGLKETKKFQNLRGDAAQQIRTIQEAGLWVLAGFIVGFDSDDESIFARQLEFIDRTGIAWAMAGVLQAPPTTPLYERMKRDGRLFEDSEALSNFSAPNFRTVMPLTTLLRGLSQMLATLYEPKAFFDRAFRSLQIWKLNPAQRPPDLPMMYNLRVLFSSMWTQGICSNYRLAYWQFLGKMIRHWYNQPAKQWLGFMVLLSAHHFLIYAREVAADLERSCQDTAAVPEPVESLVTAARVS